MTRASPDWDADLAALLETQCALVDRLAPLAEKQRTLVEGGDMPALLELLAQRQAIVDRFAATERRLAELTDGMPERLEGLAAERRRALAALVDRVDAGLRSIAEADARDGAALAQGRDATAAEIATLGTAAAARRAYLGSGSSGARFADRTG